MVCFETFSQQKVQHLIERCLRLYMTQDEAVTALHIYQNIDPNFIQLGFEEFSFLIYFIVWEKLEEQNPAFFNAYSIRLKVKQQISDFNFLVGQHAIQVQKRSKKKVFLNSSS
jgi:uncharacterized protein (TIGR01589 family)